MVAFEGRDAYIVLAIGRPREASPFTERDVAKLQLLIPHLRRAGEVYTRLLMAERRTQDMEQVFDDMALATFVLNASGEVAFANKAAKNLVEARGGLSLAGRELRSEDKVITDALKTHIFEATHRPGLQNSKKVRHLDLPRRGGGPPFRATVCPLSIDPCLTSEWLTSETQAAVFVTDPMLSYETSIEKLQRLYGLTTTESEVLQSLVAGLSTKDIANQTNRSTETVRRHIKNIFGKTGTNRQADLIRLVLSDMQTPAPSVREF